MSHKIINTDEKKSLISNFFSLSILQSANYILPLITMPYLLRVLGVEYYGLLSFATAIIVYFQILTDYGFNLSATRQISINRENKCKLIEIFSSVLIIKTLLMFLSFILLCILIYSIEKFNTEALLYFYTFSTIIGNALFPVWFFQGIEKMKYITYLNILSKTIFTLAIFIFVKNESDYLMVPLLTAIGSLLSALISLVLIKKIFDISFQLQNINTIKYYYIDGWEIFKSRVFSSFYRSSNVIIIGLITNNTFVGYYAIAEKTIKILQALQDVVGNTLYPSLSRKFHKDKTLFFRLNKKYFRVVFIVYLLLCIFVFLLAKFIVTFLTGSFVPDIVTNLRIMSLVLLVGGLNYYFGILGLVSLNYKSEFASYVMYTGIINIILCFGAVYLFKDTGAAVVMVLSELILLILIVSKLAKIKREIIL